MDKKMPGYTGYKPQFEDEVPGFEGEKIMRDNRYYIPGYSGFVPNIKSENLFAQSYGETTKKSVAQDIPKGFVQSPDEKFKSMTQDKYCDMSLKSREARPAECFEPGYDTVFFKSHERATREMQTMQKMSAAEMRAAAPQIQMSYAEARAQAYGQEKKEEWCPTAQQMEDCKPVYLAHKASRAALPAEVQAILATPPPPAQMMQMMAAMFKEADANKDGLLNCDEWLHFRKLFTDTQAAMAGGAVTVSEECDKLAYNVLNKLDCSYNGLKGDDMMKMMKTFGMLKEQGF